MRPAEVQALGNDFGGDAADNSNTVARSATAIARYRSARDRKLSQLQGLLLAARDALAPSIPRQFGLRNFSGALSVMDQGRRCSSAATRRPARPRMYWRAGCLDFTSVILRTANALVRELGSAVQPPKGIAIVLTEEPGAQPNWVTAGMMEAALTDKFSEKVGELRKTDPLVDWTGVDKGHAEFRRVVKFLSTATD